MAAKSFVGRIYQLTSPDIDKVYVGSTTQTLKGRFWDHKSAYEAFTQRGKGNRVAAFEILKYSNVDVELLVEETFTSKKDMYILEGRYIQVTPNCVNKCTPCVNINEEYYKQYKTDYNKEYRQQHKDDLAEQKREYYQAHKDVIIQRSKERHEKLKEESPEHLKEKAAKYEDKHKDKLRQKLNCEICGGS